MSSKQTVMPAIRTIGVAVALLNVTALAMTAEVTVDKDVPKRAKARFFERVQAGDVANAIAQRGQAVDFKPDRYHLKVPCDSTKQGSFADITVTIDDSSKTRLRLQECGVQVDSH